MVRHARFMVGLLLASVLVAPAAPAAASGARPASPALPPLVASYAFDEGAGTTAADASGGGHTGALQGTAAWGRGIVGASSLALTGGGFVDVAGPVVDTTTSFSVSAWAR